VRREEKERREERTRARRHRWEESGVVCRWAL